MNSVTLGRDVKTVKQDQSANAGASKPYFPSAIWNHIGSNLRCFVHGPAELSRNLARIISSPMFV